MRFAFDDFLLDQDRRELTRAGEGVALEPQVFDLILHLMMNRDRVVTRDDLVEAVWGGRIVSDSTLASRINAARRALGDSGGRQALIRTLPRKGFRFVGNVAAAEDDHPAHRPAGAAAMPDWGGRPSVAVLPFANLSDDPGQDYFADGITEDIIAALSKYRSLVVIARNPAFAFRGASGDMREAGLSLGAEYLVSGSVRRGGERLRVSVQLTETETGRQIWAERHDRDVADLFAVQDEITEAVAGQVEPEIGEAERQRVARKAVPALHAWDFFRLGTRHFYRSTAADNHEAQRLFRRAIELEPGLAEAWGYLSYAQVLAMVYFDADPLPERLAEAIAIGRRAVELDERDGLIRFMYGRALLAAQDYGTALAELETALKLNPCLAVSYCGLGDTLAYTGRIPEAIAQFQKAIDLSPHDPLRWAFYSYRSVAHLFAHEFEAAEDWALRATRVPNAHYWAFAHRLAALGHLGREQEGAVARGDLCDRCPGFSCSYARKRLFYIRRPEQIAVYLDGLERAGLPF